MMPLDNCLNRDIDGSFSRHVLVSRASGGSLNKDDARFFPLATPKNAAHAYRRIWDPTTGVAPPSKRIIQDINKVQDAMVQIHRQKGAFVPNLVQRPGDHHIINQLKSEIWGGKRTEPIFVMAHEKIVSHTRKKMEQTTEEKSSSKDIAILHMEYHPDDIMRKRVRDLWVENCTLL